ncbi:MAG: hypothetical protein LBH96_04555, partial [Candidatus Peribacteria bacterium]|nr:hypothetical protein [Candidatus Peribacteria bacterium]
SELQQAFNEAAKKGDMQRVSAIMKERDEKKKAENETLINENTSLEEVYKSLTSFEDNENAAWQNDIGTDEEKKQRRQKLKKFILEDIKTYKSNLDQQHKTLTDAKQTQINDLMKLLGEKDTEINDLTRKNEHLQERVLKLPNWQEIAPGAPGRRLNNLANQLKALSKAD